jgi:hypothetical protein
MAVPSVIGDLSQTAASNSPQGSEAIGSPGSIDDYLRAGFAFIAQLQALKANLASPTFTGAVALPTSWSINGVTITPTGAEFNYVAGVTSAIQTQINAKAPSASPTITGHATIEGVTLTGATGTGNLVLSNSPTFTGTVTGISASSVGLGNVTNESKSTMFSSPTFTGTVTMPTTAHGNSAISGIKWAAFNGEYNAGSGTAITPDFANGQKQYCTMGSGTTTVTLNTGSFPGVGHYQLRIIQYSTAGALAFAGTAYSASRWLNDADANDVNSANNGESILSLYWNGTNAYLSMGKVGAV